MHTRGLRLLSCVCVRLFVCYRSNQLYSRVFLRLFTHGFSWQKLWRLKTHYSNELKLTSSRFRTLPGPTEGSNYLKEQLVCQMLVQRLCTVVEIGNCLLTTHRAYEARVCTCVVWECILYTYCCWHLLFSLWLHPEPASKNCSGFSTTH